MKQQPKRRRNREAGKRNKRFPVTGRIPVQEALRAGKRKAHCLYYLESGEGLEAIFEAAASIHAEACDRDTLDRLAEGLPHQGVVLDAEPLPIRRAEDWTAKTFPRDAIAVVLDGVTDPHNFGAIVRSAAACGACGVVFAKDRAAPVSTAATKSAAGGMEYVDLVQATNLARALDLLKKAGFWVAGLDEDGDRLLWETDLTGRIALVVGSEGEGMRRLTRERCDFVARIPLDGSLPSLNASASAAVALVECKRQRCG